MILDDFVTKTFFASRPPVNPTTAIDKVIRGFKLTPSEQRTLEYSRMDTEYVWLQSGKDILMHMKLLVQLLAGHLEDHLTFRKLTLNNLKNLNYLLTAKLVDWKQKRYSIYDVIEVSDKARSFTIKARNCFESSSSCRLD